MDNQDSQENIILFTVYGEPASKANSRRMVRFGNRPAFIKSDKAIKYGNMFLEQCPTLEKLLTDDVKVEMVIHYATRRPDLDESLILDLMQGKIYENDRQVREKHIYWGHSREKPRSIIRVSPMESGNIPSYLRCEPDGQETP